MQSLARSNRGSGKHHILSTRDYAIYALQQMQLRDRDDLNLRIALADMGTKDLTFGRLALSIPEDHYNLLAMIYPELNSKDAKEKREFVLKAVRKLELFKPYLINNKETLKGI